MYYPPINTRTAYKYGKRKWLDSLIAVKGSSNPVFKQYLTFDPAGQIIKQVSQQGTSAALPQNYFYDDLGQLIKWTKDSGTGSEASEVYVYDSVGNRATLTNKNHLGQTTSWRTHDIGRRTNLSAGPNQLLGIQNRAAPLGTVLTSNTYEYDDDGALKRRKQYTGTSTLVLDEKFAYSSWRGLSWQYERTDPNLVSGQDTWKWRYRYNAMGEREQKQKRKVLAPGGDGTASNGYEWTYYLLGGNRQQLSVWNGLQTSDATFIGSRRASCCSSCRWTGRTSPRFRRAICSDVEGDGRDVARSAREEETCGRCADPRSSRCGLSGRTKHGAGTNRRSCELEGMALQSIK